MWDRQVFTYTNYAPSHDEILLVICLFKTIHSGKVQRILFGPEAAFFYSTELDNCWFVVCIEPEI